MHFEFKTFLQGFLIIEDRISMAHSLETRVPFLDNHLADLAWRMKPTFKLKADSLEHSSNNGYFESAEGKLILRKAMQNYLPKNSSISTNKDFTPGRKLVPWPVNEIY